MSIGEFSTFAGLIRDTARADCFGVAGYLNS